MNSDISDARSQIAWDEKDVLAANAATLEMIREKKASKSAFFEDRGSLDVFAAEEAEDFGEGAQLALARQDLPRASCRSSRSSIASATSFGTRRRRAEESSMEITHSVIGESANLRLEAQRLFGAESTRAEKQAVKNAPLGKDVQEKLEKRIARDETLANNLERALHSAEPMIYVLEQCLNDLERAHKNFWPQVSVAKQRQELRERCPTGELDKDYLQKALKYEQKMVSRGRKSLVSAREEGVQLLKEFNAHFKASKDALKKKRFAAGHDKTCLLVMQEKEKASSKLLAANEQVEADRESWAASVQGLLRDLVDLDRQTRDYRASIDDLILDKKQIAADAANQTSELFRKHTAEMQRLRKLLEKEMHESHDTISSMEHMLARSKQQLTKTQQTVKIAGATHKKATTSAAHRERSTLVESIQTNFEKVSSSHNALEQQIAWNQALLNDMRNSHKALEDDYHMKSIAMKYTDQCLLVTPKPEEDPRTARSRAMEAERRKRAEHVAEELKPDHLAEIHRRMRAAAPLGFAGRPDFDALIQKINPDRLGELTDHQIKVGIRSKMRLAPDVISDQQITRLCNLLDVNGNGFVHVKELKAFLEQEPKHDIDDIPDFDFGEELSAKAKRDLAEEKEWVRPPRRGVPLLKKSQMQMLKQRIKSAASIVALDHHSMGSEDDQVRDLFEMFDKDCSGLLSDLEVKKAFRYGLKINKRDLTDLEVWAIIHLIDVNDSGKVDVNELVNWVHDV